MPGGPGARRPVEDATWPAGLLAHGIALFNHGCYWEAHEAWERLWQAAPRRSDESRMLQGLIALAAAGVKVRQGQAAGIARHARRAAGFFAELGGNAVAGFNRDALIAFAAAIATTPPRRATGPAPEIVFARPLPLPLESPPCPSN